MKTYLDFTLQPQKFLNIWLLFYVLVLVPYGWYTYRVSSGKFEMLHPGGFLLGAILVMLFALGIYFYFTRVFMEHIRLGEKKVEFTASFPAYLNKVIPGFLLSMLSLGIYFAWFIRDILRFFAGSIRLDGEAFEFRGSSLRLFTILFLSLFLPLIVVSLLTFQLPTELLESTWFAIVNQAVFMIIMVPYTYLLWVWIINFRYRDQYIYLNTPFSEAALFILKELGLAIITLGVYFPMMYLKVYKYFAERTIVAKDESYRTLGYDLEAGEDFVFIWRQALLCIVTLGLYVPWAFSKIGKRILSKTFLSEPIPTP